MGQLNGGTEGKECWLWEGKYLGYYLNVKQL